MLEEQKKENKKFLLVGLGNPGEKYKNTPHNIGREAVVYFAQKNNFPEFVIDKKSNSLKSIGEVSGSQTVLVLPQTFMNLSGLSVDTVISYGNMEIESLVVLHDDIDLPKGQIRLSLGRGSGGHKGVKSIIDSLNTVGFLRLRIGVCPQTKPSESSDFVLSVQKVEEETLFKISEVLDGLIKFGLEKTMNKYN